MADQVMFVQRIEKPDWCRTSDINREIADLVAHSYVDTAPLLEREFEHNDLLYYILDHDGRLVTFFMVARECLLIGGRRTPAVFLGLSATSRRTKGSGIVRRVYEKFLAEARGWERALDRPLLLWATTATPSAYHACSVLFADVQPIPDGGYSADGATVANSLRRLHGLGTAGTTEHPFVMRDVATGTRYSAEEETRIDAICKEKGFDLFERTGVDQRMGDRLLLTSRLPDSVRAEPLS